MIEYSWEYTPVVERTRQAFRLIEKFRADQSDFMRGQGISEEGIRWVQWRFETDDFAFLTRLTAGKLARHLRANFREELILTYD